MIVETKKDSATWAAACELGDAHVVLREGEVTSVVLQAVADGDPPLLVCGSRHAGLAERLFTSTIGSALASRASCPLAVVPDDWQPGGETSRRR